MNWYFKLCNGFQTKWLQTKHLWYLLIQSRYHYLPGLHWLYSILFNTRQKNRPNSLHSSKKTLTLQMKVPLRTSEGSKLQNFPMDTSKWPNQASSANTSRQKSTTWLKEAWFTCNNQNVVQRLLGRTFQWNLELQVSCRKIIPFAQKHTSWHQIGSAIMCQIPIQSK